MAIQLSNQHVTVVGKTDSGKSVFGLNLLQSYYKSGWKIVIIDIGASWSHFATTREQSTIERPHLYRGNLKATRHLAVEYYVPDTPGYNDKTLYNLYAQALEEGNIILYHDEVIGIATGGQSITTLDRVLSQGRKKYCIGFFCTQRPKNIPRLILTQSSYIVCFKLTDVEDADVMAKRMHIDALLDKKGNVNVNAWKANFQYFEYFEKTMDKAVLRPALPESSARRVKVL